MIPVIRKSLPYRYVLDHHNQCEYSRCFPSRTAQHVLKTTDAWVKTVIIRPRRANGNILKNLLYILMILNIVLLKPFFGMQMFCKFCARIERSSFDNFLVTTISAFLIWQLRLFSSTQSIGSVLDEIHD